MAAGDTVARLSYIAYIYIYIYTLWLFFVCREDRDSKRCACYRYRDD